MTVPQEYWSASKDFERFMGDLKQISMLATHNQCYAMTRAVLHVFRGHLRIGDALAFAAALPPVLRAIFVEDWVPSSMPAAFPSRTELMVEVRAVRADHNTATGNAIGDVAAALRRNVNTRRLDAVLARLGPDAQAFWAAPEN